MDCKILLQVGDDNYHNNISDAVTYMRNIPNDVTIISGDNEEIFSNKYILSLFSSTLRHLLSTSSTLIFPECSTLSIKYLLNVINNGFVVTEKLSVKDINEISKTAKLLSIEKLVLCQDETIPSFAKTLQVATSSEIKKSAIDVSEHRNDENPESVIDSLLRIFDPDYKEEEYVPIGENFDIINEPELVEPTAKKRKKSEISRNNGKYSCQECDYESKFSGNVRKHVEAKHEGICYACDQCEYKATQPGNLQRYVNVMLRGAFYRFGQGSM